MRNPGSVSGEANENQVRLSFCTANDLRPRSDAVLELQAACYSPPPWCYSEQEVAEYADELQRHLNHDGFEAVVALDGDGLAGVAYGFTGPVQIPDDGGFYRSVVQALGRTRVDQELAGQPFEVLQVMVHPGRRRIGIARTLLSRLVDHHPRAWLATLPDSPAARLYQKAGWRRLRPTFDLWGRDCEVWLRSPPQHPFTATH